MSPVACPLWHSPCGMSPVACPLWRVPCGMSPVLCPLCCVPCGVWHMSPVLCPLCCVPFGVSPVACPLWRVPCACPLWRVPCAVSCPLWLLMLTSQPGPLPSMPRIQAGGPDWGTVWVILAIQEVSSGSALFNDLHWTPCLLPASSARLSTIIWFAWRLPGLTRWADNTDWIIPGDYCPGSEPGAGLRGRGRRRQGWTLQDLEDDPHQPHPVKSGFLVSTPPPVWTGTTLSGSHTYTEIQGPLLKPHSFINHFMISDVRGYSPMFTISRILYI